MSGISYHRNLQAFTNPYFALILWTNISLEFRQSLFLHERNGMYNSLQKYSVFVSYLEARTRKNKGVCLDVKFVKFIVENQLQTITIINGNMSFSWMIHSLNIGQ